MAESTGAISGTRERVRELLLELGHSTAAVLGERLALSPRQRDVFALLVEGRANKDIAATLRCSERNVEFHVGRILRSAHVTSRSELLVKVLGTPA